MTEPTEPQIGDVIDTVEQLDALPDGTQLRAGRHVYENYTEAYGGQYWHSIGSDWFRDSARILEENLGQPFTVIWTK